MQLKIFTSSSILRALALMHLATALIYMGFAATYQLKNKHFLAGAPDFLAYYTAYQLAREGKSPFDINLFTKKQGLVLREDGISQKPDSVLLFLNPPQALLLFAPLGHADYATAFTLWLIGNLLLSAALCRDIYSALARYGRTAQRFGVAFSIGIFPWGMTLEQGQISILLALALMRFLIEYQRNRMFHAALWVSFLSIKPHFFVFMLVPLLLFRQWRLLIYCAGVMVFLIAVTTWFFGHSIWAQYAQLLQLMLQDGGRYGASLHAMVNLRGVMTRYLDVASGALFNFLYLGAFLYTLAQAGFCRRGTLQSQAAMLAGSVVLAAWAGPWLHGHDVYLFLPVAVFLCATSENTPQKALPALYMATLIGTLFQPSQQIMAAAIQCGLILWTRITLKQHEYEQTIL